jgi:hypothetical protein
MWFVQSASQRSQLNNNDHKKWDELVSFVCDDDCGKNSTEQTTGRLFFPPPPRYGMVCVFGRLLVMKV